MKEVHSLKLRAMVILMAVVCVFMVIPAKGTNISVSGTIAAPTTWSVDTVKVTGDLLISNGVTLTINPGVKVIFQGHYKIDVQGRILASGTSSAPIYFAINDTTGFTNMTIPAGGWGGIRFDSTLAVNDTSKFAWCHFTNGKANGTGDLAHGGGLYIYYFNKVTVQHSTFNRCRASNDGGAICVKSATAFISGNNFLNGNCARGGGVYCENAYPRVERNTFNGNYASSMGGCICVSNAAAPAILDNLFYGNLAYLGGAIAFFNGGAMTTLVSNTIVDNRANYGGGISSIATDASLTNNIIWGNEAAEGLQVTLLDPDSDPSFNYCNIQGALAGFGGSGAGAAYSGSYTNNLNTYPQFADTLVYDYQIKTISPCLDAGTPDTTGLHLPLFDLAGNPRINMGRIDIGAYERQQVVTYCGNISQNTLWNADTVKVMCDITVLAGSTLTIAPGVYVEMQGFYEIAVLGRIQAIGNTTEPITFTAKNQTNGWEGLRFRLPGSSTDSSRLHYCHVSYVLNAPFSNDGAVLLDSVSRVSIKHCSIYNNTGYNGAGISLEHASPLIAHTNIYDNDAHPSLGKGGGIYARSGSAPKLKSLVIYNNSSADGAGLYISEGYLQSENLFISNNSSNYGGGISIDTSLVLLTNSIIVNNTTNFDGGGIYASRSDVTLNNTDIVNNLVLGNGGALYLSKTIARMNNTVLYGNRKNPSINQQVYIADTFCTTNINYCDVEGDTTEFAYAGGSEFEGSYGHNLDTLPGFFAPTPFAGGAYYGLTADWSLDACSPLYNLGTPSIGGLYILSYDYAGNARVYADTIDMGAYELITPYITSQPHDTAACAGNTIYFSVNANSSVVEYYQWQIKPFGSGSFVDVVGPGSATNTYTVSGISPAMNGDQYQCVITAVCTDELVSTAVELTVYTSPAIQTEPVAVSVCQGTTANFNVTATGSNLSYQWQQRPFGSATWSNCIGASATTANYSIPGTPPALNNYSYRCLVNGSCVPADTSVIVDLTVKSLPGVVTHPTNQSVCTGEDASFTVSGSGAGITYQWQESTNGGTIWNNISLQTATTLNLTGVTTLMNGYKYRCVISGDCTPAATSNVATLSVNTAPMISQQPVNTDACVYSNVNIPVTATGGNLTFQWEQKGPADLAWSNAPGLSALTSTYQLVNVAMLMNGTKYRCQISGSCTPATTSDSVVLHVYNLPSFYVGQDTSMLLSHTITLDAGAGYSEYLWSTTETTQTISVVGSVIGIGAHSYTCTVTDIHGCQNNDALIVTVLDDFGIDPISSIAPFEISPNPALTYFSISSVDAKARTTHIRVMDILGKCILDASYVVNSGAVIDVRTWPAGSYFIQITKEQSTQHLRLNKQ